MYHHDMEHLLCPRAWALSRWEIFTAALLLVATFFSDWLKMSSTQDVSSALNRWSRERGSVFYTACLAHKQMNEQYTEKSQAPPSNALRKRLLQT